MTHLMPFQDGGDKHVVWHTPLETKCKSLNNNPNNCKCNYCGAVIIFVNTNATMTIKYFNY